MTERLYPPADLSRLYYPPPPWLLRGSALVATFRVASAAIQPFIPAPLSLVNMPGGLAMAFLCVARYGAGSTLAYSELLAGVVVRYGLRFSPYITHIGVDDRSSQRAGRELWYLPKELWQFEWEFHEHETMVRVWDGTLLICSISGITTKTRFFPFRTNATFLNTRGTDVATITGDVDARVIPTPWQLQIGPDGPLVPLQPNGRMLTFAAKGVVDVQALAVLE